MAASARIVVRRPRGGLRDRLRSYRIEIDGAQAGKVAQGRQVEFPVTPGAHEVRAAIDWAGSPAVRVELAAGEIAHLTVEPGGGPAQAWQSFTKERYLKLTGGDGPAELPTVTWRGIMRRRWTRHPWLTGLQNLFLLVSLGCWAALVIRHDGIWLVGAFVTVMISLVCGLIRRGLERRPESE